MTPDEYRAALALLGMSGEAFARAIGVSGKAQRNWKMSADKSSAAPVPASVALILEWAQRYPNLRDDLARRGRISN